MIGNLTSLLFSNILLDELDRYLRFDLGYKYTGRYVDDFYMIVPEAEIDKLSDNLNAVREFLKRKELTLHPRKIYIQKAEKGVQFLGGVVYPRHLEPSNRVKTNYRKALKEYLEGKRPVESLVSYHGHVIHFAHKKFESELFNEIEWCPNGGQGRRTT